MRQTGKNRSEARPPTLGDVAREAGVSAVAVSVVLNRARSATRVSEAARQRIHEAAQRLRYTPNLAARSLAQGRNRTVGVVMGSLGFHHERLDGAEHSYTLLLLEGIVQECGRRGHNVFLFTEGWRESPEGLETLRDRRVDGLILLAPPADTQILAELAVLNIRFVSIAHPATGLNVTSVDVDDRAGSRMALEHLWNLGHRRIAHIIGARDAMSTQIRLQTYQEFLHEKGLTPDAAYVTDGFPPTGSGQPTLQRNVQSLLAQPHPPTAVFACNDALALRTLQIAAAQGVAVPRDLSVIGYDDRPVAAATTPPLTTVRQPMLEIGRVAAAALLDEIAPENPDAEPAKGRTLLKPELIVRGSTAPPFGQ